MIEDLTPKPEKPPLHFRYTCDICGKQIETAGVGWYILSRTSPRWGRHDICSLVCLRELVNKKLEEDNG